MTVKMKEIRVFGGKKRSKTLAGHELGENLFKYEVRGYIMSIQDNVLMKYGYSLGKIGHIF